jgi:hypothetical protein
MFPGRPTPRFYDRVVETPRTRHYSRRTGEAYLHWIRRFLVFHNGTQPRELAEGQVNLFVTHLTGVGHASACHVLERPLDRVEGAVRSRRPKRLPAVLTREEVAAVLAHLDGVPRLVCTLLYGSGLRLLEALHEPLEDHVHAWVEPWRAGDPQPAGPAPQARIRRDWGDQAGRPVSLKSHKEGCQMRRKSLQASELPPKPARWQVRLRLTESGLRLVSRNRS